MKLKGITRNVIVLGWVSFFTDLASEMLYPIIPLFVVGTLGASPAILGLIDGLAEGVSSGLRWIGGALSDRSGKRRPFVMAGYAISALSKPIMGLSAVAGGWPMFLLGRSSDRLGKSIRTAARDALIADSTEPAYRGVAFGVHRTMDTCGAVAGPLTALALITLWPALPLQWVFLAAAIPGLCSVLLVWTAVKEIPAAQHGEGKPPAIFQPFPKAFWWLLTANAIFSLGNSSDSFLLLRSNELGLSTASVILAFALYNVVYAAAATPLGHLSDRIGRRPVIVTGWLVYAGVYAGFAISGSPAAPWLLMGLYGLYQAMTEGVTKAMVSDVVPANQRAGAIGMYATAAGLGQLVGSVLAGAAWNWKLLGAGVMMPFAIGAAFALLAIPMIAMVPLPAAMAVEAKP